MYVCMFDAGQHDFILTHPITQQPINFLPLPNANPLVARSKLCNFVSSQCLRSSVQVPLVISPSNVFNFPFIDNDNIEFSNKFHPRCNPFRDAKRFYPIRDSIKIHSRLAANTLKDSNDIRYNSTWLRGS